MVFEITNTTTGSHGDLNRDRDCACDVMKVFAIKNRR
jgi:hypothetical protein